jgi:uncharacterized protein (TIGR04255 family)
MPSLPVRFENAPIVEIALGVHFAPLAKLSSGHLGWFWSRMGRDWTSGVDAMPLPQQLELFDVPSGWVMPGIQFMVGSTPSVRLQVMNEGKDRMVQLQSSRLHYNWRKAAAPYPSYQVIRDEFISWYNAFRTFVAEKSIGEVTPLQWEVSYVDYQARGDLWQSPADWYRILPGLLGPGPSNEAAKIEVASGEWRYELVPRRGRLYINVNLGTASDATEPGLLLQTTARGPISKEEGFDLSRGLDFAHDRIREMFLSIISEQAKTTWGLHS